MLASIAAAISSLSESCEMLPPFSSCPRYELKGTKQQPNPGHERKLLVTGGGTAGRCINLCQSVLMAYVVSDSADKTLHHLGCFEENKISFLITNVDNVYDKTLTKTELFIS